jgi:hypothetical protein
MKNPMLIWVALAGGRDTDICIDTIYDYVNYDTEELVWADPEEYDDPDVTNDDAFRVNTTLTVIQDLWNFMDHSDIYGW